MKPKDVLNRILFTSSFNDVGYWMNSRRDGVSFAARHWCFIEPSTEKTWHDLNPFEPKGKGTSVANDKVGFFNNDLLVLFFVCSSSDKRTAADERREAANSWPGHSTQKAST